MGPIRLRHALRTALVTLLGVGWALVTGPPAARADVNITDDLIVWGDACVGGTDCVIGEPFGSDTLRLKDNVVQLHFEDTSITSNFPSNDWRIRINDPDLGGANYFAVDDVTGARTPFRIDAAAPFHALRVSGTGGLDGEVRVGFGTATPLVELHAVDGDTPRLRLEQDASGSFPPQSWQLGGNEINFFMQDVTNASVPVRIFAGAPSNSLVTAATGDIGLGTASPAASLHVARAGPATVAFEDTNAATTWTAGIDGVNFVIDNGQCNIFGGTGRCLILTDTGDLQIDGAFAQASSRASKRDIEPVDPEAVLARVAALPIAAWRYRDDTQEARHMGPMAEDFHAAFALGSNARYLAPGDTAGVALAAIQGLKQELEALRADRDALAARLRAAEARLPQERSGD